MIRLMTASLNLSLASLQALALMFASRPSVTSQTGVHTYLYALLIFQKFLIELITERYLTSYWTTMLIVKLLEFWLLGTVHKRALSNGVVWPL